jgi:hypothetical protein
MPASLVSLDALAWHMMYMVHTQAIMKNDEAPVNELTYLEK